MKYKIIFLFFIYCIIFYIINRYIYNYISIEKLENINIKKIINVYKEGYKNNTKTPGFGDYLRGCYFLLQLTDDLNIEYGFVITHPISYFLKNNTNDSIPSLDIDYNLELNNFKKNITNDNIIINEYIYDIDFINNYKKYINNITTIKNNTLYTCINAFPIYKIKENHKLIIRNLIEPTDDMKKYIDENLLILNFKKKKYITIHIRSGDEILLDKKNLSQIYINKIITKIDEILLKNDDKFILLISDNNNLKKHINSIYNNIKILNNNIIHLGEEKVLKNDDIKQTLLDMYLLSETNYVYSLTYYIHGSGFSQWIALTYNIPYELYYFGPPQ